MGIFYNYCKFNTQLTSHLFYNNILVSGAENIPQDKPLLLVANHPNSFLDAIVIGAAINRPTYFLARGDAFNNKYALPILKSLNMLPVYRLSEGKENLNKNSETFDACHQILEKKETVLIFSEGISFNNWDLRPLKKGPARVAKKAWASKDAGDMVIVPVGLTYEHFKGGGKNILINIGQAFYKEDFHTEDLEASFVKKFNDKISSAFEKLAYVNPQLIEGTPDYEGFRKRFQFAVNNKMNAMEALQYLKGQETPTIKISDRQFILNSLLFAPLYVLSTWLTPKIVKQKLFFDSISFGLVMFLWPVYLIVLGYLIAYFLN